MNDKKIKKSILLFLTPEEHEQYKKFFANSPYVQTKFIKDIIFNEINKQQQQGE